MSELRSAVESLRAEVLPDLPDARIEDDFTELHRVAELLEFERLRRLAELERRRLFGTGRAPVGRIVAREHAQGLVGSGTR